jgi:hypothetical protein
MRAKGSSIQVETNHGHVSPSLPPATAAALTALSGKKNTGCPAWEENVDSSETALRLSAPPRGGSKPDGARPDHEQAAQAQLTRYSALREAAE